MTRPSDITRERILKAAERLFADRGYEETSIRAIVTKAREVVQDCVIDLVVSEYRLVLFEAQAPQPTPDVHDGVLIPRWRAMIG